MVASGRLRSAGALSRAGIYTLSALLSGAGGLTGVGIETAHAAAPVPRQLLNTFVEELVVISPGTDKFPAAFTQGDKAEPLEHPVREVTLSQPFSIGRYEVTQELYEAVMGQNPSRWKGTRNAAESMSWNDAVEFCDRLTQELRRAALIGNDEVIRLPSESEWEYCARAGTTTAFSFGDEAQADGDVGPRATLLDPYAWHHGNAANNDPAVGALRPNPWGLYDVHGYLWEFCADEWHADYRGAPSDGSVWRGAAPRRRVIRGGSWKDEFQRLRSAARQPINPTQTDDAIGFRCVRSHE